MDGNGVNFKMGVILRPIDNIRLGFAFHTPTYYTMTNRMGVSVPIISENRIREFSLILPFLFWKMHMIMIFSLPGVL